VRVEYRVSASELLISAWFDSDRPTPVSATNHAYWNLAATSGFFPDSRPAMTIDGRELVLDAGDVLAVDAAKLPTGRTLGGPSISPMPRTAPVWPKCGSAPGLPSAAGRTGGSGTGSAAVDRPA